MPWILLFLAGLFEIAWAFGLKETDGFTRLLPTLGTLVALLLSVGLLGLAARSLPLSTAYVVWTGIGALGTVIGGILLGTEPVNFARLLCLALIVTGVLGLKFSA